MVHGPHGSHGFSLSAPSSTLSAADWAASSTAALPLPTSSLHGGAQARCSSSAGLGKGQVPHQGRWLGDSGVLMGAWGQATLARGQTHNCLATWGGGGWPLFSPLILPSNPGSFPHLLCPLSSSYFCRASSATCSARLRTSPAASFAESAAFFTPDRARSARSYSAGMQGGGLTPLKAGHLRGQVA